MLGIELHSLLIVTRQIHVVYSKLEFGFLKFGSATSDFVLFINRTVVKTVGSSN